ncbi:MAG: O-antigen ligase family protein [Opitutus sp.]
MPSSSDKILSADDHLVAAARCAAVAITVLPFLLLLSIDYDRVAVLALIPAILLGRNRAGRTSPADRAAMIDRALLVTGCGFALISCLTGPHRAASLTTLSSLVWIVATALLARRCAAAPRALRLLLLGLCGGAALGCLGVWWAWHGRSSSGVFPFYGHWRIFGLHMMVGAMCGLGLLLETKRSRAEQMLTGLATAVTAGGLLWSGGRAPLAGAFAGLTLWFWRLPSVKRGRFVLVTLSLLGVGLGLSVLQWSPESYLGWWTAVDRTVAATSVNELTSTRADFWRASWIHFQQHPWLGYGADAYRYLTPKMDGDQPHNWLLQLLLDFGVVGGIAAAALLVRQGLRGIANARDGSDTSALRLAATAAFAACLATGLLDGVFYHAVVLIPAAILGGIAGAPRRRGSSLVPSHSSAPGHSFTACKSALVAAAVVCLGLHSYLVYHLRFAVVPLPNSTPAQVLRQFPSTTTGIDRWLEAWKKRDDSLALAWALWAQKHAAGPAPLYLFAAVIYADHDDFAAADQQMAAALQSAHWTSRPALEHMRASIQAAAPSSTKESR